MPGTPSAAAQLAHLAFPLATGEEAPFNDAGTPAVLVQVSGERGPSAGEPVSESRLLNFGGACSARPTRSMKVPNSPEPPPRVLMGRKTLPGGRSGCSRSRCCCRRCWCASMRWRACAGAASRIGAGWCGRSPARFRSWSCALLRSCSGALAIVAAPAGQLSAASLSADGSPAGALVCAALVLVLALLAWPALVRRLALPVRPTADGAGLAAMLVLLAVALARLGLQPVCLPVARSGASPVAVCC